MSRKNFTDQATQDLAIVTTEDTNYAAAVAATDTAYDQFISAKTNYDQAVAAEAAAKAALDTAIATHQASYKAVPAPPVPEDGPVVQPVGAQRTG